MKKRDSFHPAAQLELFQLAEHRRFVVHAHKTRFGVHYDFRFEAGKVLIDFCLPHGFSVNPRKTRRAIEQPVHDRKCLTMPEWSLLGEDGVSEAMLRWDEGTVEILGESEETQAARLEAGLQQGMMRIMFNGVKLHGVWLFVRDTKGWKVQKEHDVHASTRNVLRENWSVLTRRSLPAVLAEIGIHDGVKFAPQHAI